MTAGPDRPPSPTDRHGTLGMDAGGEWQIRFERRLAHPVERVWAALTSPDQQASWMPGVTIDASEGGSVVFDFGDEGRADGRVLAVDAPRSLEHTWMWQGEPPATVRWELTADGDHTVLVLLHRPVRSDAAVDYSTGWHTILDSFGAHLDGTEPAEPDLAALYDFYRAMAKASGPS